jgi:uncharacterized protein YdeI (YjbR/CyaY-like superfamily)
MSNPLFFATPQTFRAWLSANGTAAEELIVGFHKIATGTPCMTWSESVDEALCFGWIDGVRKRIDDLTYSIRFTPRKRDSIWSAVNIAKVARLSAERRMTSAGAAAYAMRTEAKSAVYSHEQTSIAELRPDELEAFLRENTGWAFFQAQPAGYRKRVLRITTAKKDSTRSGRFAALLKACALTNRLPQFK